MYTIGDFLIQLKNSSKASKKAIEYPYSNAVFSIAKILEKEGFINKVSVSQEKNPPSPRHGGATARFAKASSRRARQGKKLLKIELKYNKNLPSISDIKLISKPSIHYYVSKNRMARSIQKNAVGIVSTNKGIMTIRDAQKQGIGGELICQIY
ncbi:MAG: 30S ribosomal protein S8 [Candidatus Levybacteria bacterium RIFCSPHIGHO2_01_FULL_40_15b]|nr:MAG: 30S ribosomal protein S8 [Candidatus Levybacteria bacterium RIFCSPHIGHO2_01_FULL_40_15b]